MPTEERFSVQPAEKETVYPEAPKSPSVPPSPNAPGRAPFQDHLDQLQDQEVQPDQTGNMPGINLNAGAEDEGPTVSPEGQGPAGTANSGF